MTSAGADVYLLGDTTIDTSNGRVLIFGVFLAGNDIAGIYTRAGARITGREAVYLPALRRSRT